MLTVNRYEQFRMNGVIKCVPFIKIPIRNTDLYTYYEVGKTRFDLLSYQYYGNPNYANYIILHNHIVHPDLIKVGERIKIPQLMQE